MNRNRSLARGVIFLTILCWFTPSPTAQPLTSLSATAASYIERGNAWAAKGEWERALTDMALAFYSFTSFFMSSNFGRRFVSNSS